MSPDAPTLADTPTQTPSLGQVDQALADAAEAVSTAAVEEQESEPPAEGKAESVEEQPSVELPDGWDSAEPVLERLKTAETEGYNKAKSHLTRAHNATLSEIESTHQDEIRLANERAQAAQLVQTFASAVQDLDLTDSDQAKGLRNLLATNNSWAQIFQGHQERDAQAGLVNLITSDERWTKDLSEETSDEFNATVRELALKLRSSVARAQSREDVTRAYAASLNTYLEERDKLRDAVVVATAIASEKKRLETEARKAAGLTDRATTRDGQAPPVRKVGGAGDGARPEAEVLMDPKTPINELQKMLAPKGIAT